jgi:hypothetical protein
MGCSTCHRYRRMCRCDQPFGFFADACLLYPQLSIGVEFVRIKAGLAYQFSRKASSRWVYNCLVRLTWMRPDFCRLSRGCVMCVSGGGLPSRDGMCACRLRQCQSPRIGVFLVYARAASTIFTLLRFARSCLASSYRWAPGRDLRYSAAASKIHEGHFSNNHIGKVPPRKRRLSRVSTSNTHQSTIHHMLAPILGTANKAAQQVIQLKSRENDLSHRHTPISVQAKLHLAVVGLVWRDWFCGRLQGS